MNKIIIIAAAVLFLGVAGYFVLNEQPAATENEIVVKNFAFSPAVLTAEKGTTVVWTNDDAAPHQIKSAAFNSEILNKGESFQFKFDNAGTYDYLCALHPSMKGQIIVR